MHDTRTVMHGPQICPTFGESNKMDLKPQETGQPRTDKINILIPPRGTRRLSAPLETTVTASLLNNQPILMEQLWDTVPREIPSWLTQTCRYFGFEKSKQILRSYLKRLRIMRKIQQMNGAQTDLAKTANWWSSPARCCWQLLKARAIVSRQITLKIILPQESLRWPTNVNRFQTCVKRRGL